jgi:hypothetical protein
MRSVGYTDDHYRRVTEDSILAIQIFDQKKFKKKDQGFLGVINVRIGTAIDLDTGSDGKSDIWGNAYNRD